MKKIVLLAILGLQSLSPSRETGLIVGHLTRGGASSVVGIPVFARTVSEGALAGVTVTDENGGYHLTLPSGRYILSAGLLDSPTYYPGVVDRIDAKPVQVEAGSIMVFADFSLINSVDIPVNGRVVVEGGGALPLDVASFIGSALPVNSVPAIPALMRMIAQSSGGTRSSVTVRPDATFALSLPVGENQVFVQALPLGYYVKSIFAGPVDILQVPLVVTDQAQREILVTLTRMPPSSDPPGVTVSGRVSGLPADALSKWVILQSNSPTAGVPSTIAEIPIQSDGIFELRGVPPGNYTIGASQPGQPRKAIVVRSDGLSEIELAWPAPRPARGAASPPPVSLLTLRGRIDSIPGTVMPSIVRLTAIVQRPAPQTVPVDSEGSFVFREVPRAQYELRVGVESVSVVRAVSVGNQDVVGIEIKSATEARGRVVMADGSSPPSPVFQIKNEYDAGNSGNARAMQTIQREFDVNADGSFTLGVVRGEQRISVLGLPVEYSVKSIMYGSIDLLGAPLSLTSPPTSEILVTLDATAARPPNFRFTYQFGHGTLAHPNSIVSARGTFTRDMVEDPPRTFNLRLTDAELSLIEEKLDDIDFWNPQKYPPVFTMPNPGPMGCSSAGRQPIYLFVVRGEVSKELTWMDQDTVCGAPNPAGADLRSFMKLVRDILEAKPEYRALPRPRGTYVD